MLNTVVSNIPRCLIIDLDAATSIREKEKRFKALNDLNNTTVCALSNGFPTQKF